MYSGIDGFLGTRASLMVDVVVVAMAVVLPVMGWSIAQAKFRGRYLLHKRVQLVLAAALLVAVTAFEIDIQYFSKWRERAADSRYFADAWNAGAVNWSLNIHLVFAVSTAVLWVLVVVQALRKFPNPPAPCAYSPTHIFWARLAAIDMVLTTITGWVFYVLAFVM
jgi:hypothetical protein